MNTDPNTVCQPVICRWIWICVSNLWYFYICAYNVKYVKTTWYTIIPWCLKSKTDSQRTNFLLWNGLQLLYGARHRKTHSSLLVGFG
jgi:hypothetical protein